jgi:hypothetical protein
MDKRLTLAEMEAALPDTGGSPQDQGRLEMIVARPATDQRRVLESAELDLQDGLMGDDWSVLGGAKPDAQITLMNSRVIQLLAGDREAWPLAGDQLFVDFDLSQDNLPPGTRLAIGTAVLEVTNLPHTGCAKFAQRYGADAMRYVNTPEGRRLRRRGMYARVVKAGVVRVGDTIAKMTA